VEKHPGQEKEVIDMVMMAKAFAPEEDGVHGAATVDDYGYAKASSSIMPGHGGSITCEAAC
jgi:hypothetical protein